MNFWFFLWAQSRAALGLSRHLVQPAEQWLRGQKCSLLPSLWATSGQGSLVGGGVKPKQGHCSGFQRGCWRPGHINNPEETAPWHPFLIRSKHYVIQRDIKFLFWLFADAFDAYEEMFLHFTHFIFVLRRQVSLIQATLS